MGNAGDALVGFDADQNRAAVGIGHGRQDPHQFAGKLFLAFFLSGAAPVLEGADELEKLTAFLFEQQVDFVPLVSIL